MSSQITTYDRASSQIEAYVNPIAAGDFALPFEVRDEQGRQFKLTDDYASGSHLLLVFINDVDLQKYQHVFKALHTRQADFESQNIQLIVVTSHSNAAQNTQLKREHQLYCPFLNDATGAVFASYGLHKGSLPQFRALMLTPLRQIRQWIDSADDIDKSLENFMNKAAASSVTQSTPWSIPHAPILVIPNVLSTEECQALIKSFNEDVPFSIRPPRQGEFSGDYQIPVYEHNRQDRVDQIIKNPQTLQWLDQRVFDRVTPMIKKAFAFDVTRREDFHIARYVGERGGNQMGHRDNTSPSTAYRRFAFSMNLNDDFEGGEVVFNEFTKQGYRGAPGTAIVFSSSLLHEVMETTSGTRYNLISHFFNEASLQGK